MRSLRLAFIASVCASLTGCFDLDLSNTTDGEDGELTFGLDANEFLECLFGCPVDRAFVVGAVGRVRIGDSDPEERISVRLGNKKDGSVTFSESFACVADADGASRTVQFREPCRPGETLDVDRIADIVPARTGSFVLEVLDDDGDVIDALTIDAEVPAAALAIIDSGSLVTRFPGADKLPVAPVSTVEVELAFEDGNGERLYFSDFVTGLTSDDPVVANVAPGASFFQFGPPSFSVTTGESGATNLSIDLAGTRFDIPVDLTPAQ